MRYTIYKITNKLNGKFYIGKHQTNNPNDGYMGSGKAILNAIKLHGKENFIKEVLFDFDTEYEMNSKEKEIITEEFVNNPMTYNLGVGGEGGPHFKNKKHSPETIQKISETNTGKKYNYPDSWYETKYSFESGNDYWKNRIQKPVSEETKTKIREKRKLQPPPMKGKKQSEETKEKIRQAILAKRTKKNS